MEHVDKNLELEIKVRPSTQVKLMLGKALAGRGIAPPDKQLLAMLGIADFTVTPTGVQILKDEYFDDENLSLHASGSSCRVRVFGKKLQMTLKALAGPKHPGLLPREETSVELDASQYQAFLQSGEAPAAVRNAIPGFPAHLKLQLSVNNQRTVYSMVKGPETYALCVDQFTFSDPDLGSRTRDWMEIEIEAENDAARAGITSVKSKIAMILEANDNFQFSTGSKYELAVDTLNLRRPLLRALTASEGLRLTILSLGISVASLATSVFGQGFVGGTLAILALAGTAVAVLRK